MHLVVMITYDEFLKLKAVGYSHDRLMNIVCRKLSIQPEEVDDIDYNFGLHIDVWLRTNNNEE